MDIFQYARSILCLLPFELRDRVILAGGCLRAFYDGTTVKDYDLFFRSHGNYCAAVDALRSYQSWEELPSDYPGSTNFRRETGEVFNLVGFSFLEPAEQIERFDFRCCAHAIVQEDDGLRLYTRQDAEADARRRLLYVQQNNGTERTMRRIEHYVRDYGYCVVTDEDETPPRTSPGLTEALRMAARHLSRLPVRSGGGYP